MISESATVLYELGSAHALHKPVVLISSNEAHVPSDVRHVRVTYYELTNPFRGEKLIAKGAENIVSDQESSTGDSIPDGVEMYIRASNISTATTATEKATRLFFEVQNPPFQQTPQRARL